MVISESETSLIANNAFAESDSFTVSLSALDEVLGMTLSGDDWGVDVSA